MDGHEREDVVASWVIFLEKFAGFERLFHRFSGENLEQMTEPENLQEVEKDSCVSNT